jgi:hypothetical protein
VAEEVLNEQGREYVALSAWLAGKAVEHFHMFGEPLNVMELTADPRLGKPVTGQPGRVFSLPDVYASRYGERVQAKAKEAEEKKFNDEVNKRMAEERARTTGALPPAAIRHRRSSRLVLRWARGARSTRPWPSTSDSVRIAVPSPSAQ